MNLGFNFDFWQKIDSTGLFGRNTCNPKLTVVFNWGCWWHVDSLFDFLCSLLQFVIYFVSLPMLWVTMCYLLNSLKFVGLNRNLGLRNLKLYHNCWMDRCMLLFGINCLTNICLLYFQMYWCIEVGIHWLGWGVWDAKGK